MIGRLAAVGLLLGLAAAPLAAQDAGAVVGRAADVYRGLTSLRANFTQVIDDPMMGRSESRGELLQKGPSRLAMRFTEPRGDAIVVDGRSIWVYTPSSVPGQVIKRALPGGGPVYGVDLLGWFLDRPAERYTMKYLRRDRVGGRSADVVELTPTSDEMPFQRAVVWIDREDALPRRLEIEEQRGATRTLTFSRLRLNASIPDRAFRFVPPPDTRVVEQ